MGMNEKFSHLPLPLILSGKPKIFGGGKSAQRTLDNRNNRVNHGNYIKRQTVSISKFWQDRQEERMKEHLPEIKTGIPLLLEIDPKSDIKFLKGLGFDVISEIETGYVIVSNGDSSFALLNNKTDDFINEVNKKCNTPARVYSFEDDNSRFNKIFGENLKKIWDSIEDDTKYIVDISISCSGNIFELEQPPEKNDGQSDEDYKSSIKFKNWQSRYFEAYEKWDTLKSEREQEFCKFIDFYHGEYVGSFIDGESSFLYFCDSFSVRVKISGRCLRDLVLNFSPIFEIEYVNDIGIEQLHEDFFNYSNDEVVLIPPEENSPIVAVIDSGIQEEHKYLKMAIKSQDSLCYVTGTDSVADDVAEGGHGTRVTGAMLYPLGIPTQGEYQLPFFIRNARVLQENNEHSVNIGAFPPLLIKSIINEYTSKAQIKTKIYNHSVAETGACEIKHMSPWASELDSQSYDNDILFIQAAGNIYQNTIKEYLKSGYNYPDYLFDERSRIANPSQSLNALTVGAICIGDYESDDEISIGKLNEPSAFSRSGSGIWNSIKPEVVEFGGSWVKNKIGDEIRLTTPREVCLELIRKSPEGLAFSKDAIGTSFSTPRVSYIAAEIQKIYPDAPALLYRALIGQSARWPISIGDNFNNARDIIRHVGYGLPDIERATQNNEYRVTLITNEILYLKEGQANIFKVPIPEELSAVGEDYDVRIDITLSYVAKPRNTRRTIDRYLSTWLDWRCSKIGESVEAFAERILISGSSVEDDGNFNWVIGEQSNYGQADGFSRKYNTLQKDWTLIKSNQLTDSFCIAVRGHKGWDPNIPAKYTLAVSFEAVNQDVRVYEQIRQLVDIEINNIESSIEQEIQISNV